MCVCVCVSECWHVPVSLSVCSTLAPVCVSAFCQQHTPTAGANGLAWLFGHELGYASRGLVFYLDDFCVHLYVAVLAVVVVMAVVVVVVAVVAFRCFIITRCSHFIPLLLVCICDGVCVCVCVCVSVCVWMSVCWAVLVSDLVFTSIVGAVLANYAEVRALVPAASLSQSTRSSVASTLSFKLKYSGFASLCHFFFFFWILI